jgi:hypothetical protein
MYTEIRKYTTAKERMAIAKKHGVKSRAGLSYVLNDKRVNVPLLKELMNLAVKRKAEQSALQEQAKTL